MVATEGSFSAAAKLSQQSQPALLYSVKRLEEDLGVQLFLRSRSGARLTSDGQKLLELSNQVILLVQDFEKGLRGEGALDAQAVLAVQTPYLPSLIAPKLSSIAKAMRTSSVALRSSLSSMQLITWVENGSVDLAVAAEPIIPKTLNQIRLFDDWYSFYCSPSFLMRSLGQEELNRRHASLPLIFVTKSIAGVHKTLERALWEVGFESPSAVEVDSYEAVGAMASHDFGIAVLPFRTGVHLNFNLVQIKTSSLLSRLGKFAVMAVFKNPSHKKSARELRLALTLQEENITY
ncbi:MAG: LysR family transcriptional regulator [Bdellovibrionales bacterium]|nr:LysR family transcriptional regulator [Bdellovibrionales bacterium]